MIFAYSTLVFIIFGVLLWGAAAFADRRARHLKAARRQQYQKLARYLGISAKVSLLLSAFSFVLAFIMTQGMKG